MTSTSRAVLAALIVAGLGIGAGPAGTQPARIDTIEVAVTTDAGSTVAGLTAADFDVRVDGKPVSIQALVRPPAPITLIALLDVTSSMSAYGDLRDAIERSLAPSLQPEDRARIGGIANRLALSPAFTSTRKQLLEDARNVLRFRREDRYGPSPIWDALVEAVRALEPERGRRGILLVTDGRATGNTVSSVEAIQTAVAVGVVVQVLSETRTMFLPQDEDSYARVRVGLMLEELTRLTGGMILPKDSKSIQLPEPGPLIAMLVNDLRQMYTIAVAGPGPAGSAHRVEVTVKRPGLTVRARPAYRTR